MIRDFRITGANELHKKEQTTTELVRTDGMIRLWLGAISLFVADWEGAYRQTQLRREDWRMHCYSDFGMLFIDVRLPFGRADSAQAFQKIVKALVVALRKSYPQHFTIPLEEVAAIKGFTRLVPKMEDTFCIINYLDDNLIAQFNEFQYHNQLEKLKEFFTNAGVAVK